MMTHTIHIVLFVRMIFFITAFSAFEVSSELQHPGFGFITCNALFSASAFTLPGEEKQAFCGCAARCAEGLCLAVPFRQDLIKSGAAPKEGRSPEMIRVIVSGGAEPPPHIGRHSRNLELLSALKSAKDSCCSESSVHAWSEDPQRKLISPIA